MHACQRIGVGRASGSFFPALGPAMQAMLLGVIPLVLGTQSLAADAPAAASTDKQSDEASRPLRVVIDEEVAAAWSKRGMKAPPTASDQTFLRRVYLDLVGTIPTYEQAEAFLQSKDKAKRAKLIDALLADPRYAQHQADIWDMVLFGRNPPGFDADKRPGFERWLREQFAKNTPYDKMVRAILKAEGNAAEHGTPYFYMQYRRKPDDAVQAIVQRFLGVQLQCARCHDHPYEKWTQKDFYGMAAFVTRLEPVQMGSKGNEKKWVIAEQPVGEVSFTGPAGQQQAGKKGVPVKPYFLGGDVLDEPPTDKALKPIKFKSGQMPPKPPFSRKDRLAEWVTAKDSPYFAKATANRVWAQFMGRGIVHPVDDMGSDNDPSHPRLLRVLATSLAKNGFDLRWFIRELCNSSAYQVAAGGDVTDPAPKWYQRARVRPLSAEELADAWRTAVNYEAVDSRTKERMKQGDRYYPIPAGYMLGFLGEPNDGEGYFQGGIHEHLFMNNGGLSRLLSRSKGGLCHTLVNMQEPWEERVDRLFLAILSRYPDAEERNRFVGYLSAEKRPDDRVLEAMWALMTCSEFRFNH